MNVFRLLFLFTCIAAGLLWAIVSLAPGVFEQSAREHLTTRLEAESRSVLQAERAAATERGLAGATIAMSPALVDALRPAQPTLGADGTPQLPNRPTPAAAFAAAVDEVGRTVSAQTFALFDVDGALLAPTDSRALTSPAEIASAAGLASVLRERTPKSTYLALSGTLYGAALHPVRGPAGELLGAVLVAESFDSRTALSRRGASSAHVAYFVEREVVATSETDSARAVLAESLVRRQTALDLGNEFGLRRVEYDRYAPASDSEILTSLMLASAPLSLTESGGLGVVVTVDAPLPPTSLLAILVESQVFADSTVVLWAYLALGLGVFLVGLFIHDLSVDRSVQALSGRISDSVTHNDPPPLRTETFPAMLRPVARAFNGFLDAYRSQLATARRAREDAEAARDAAEAAKEEAIAAHNDAMQARVEVTERVREAEERVRAESSQAGSGMLAVAAMNAKLGVSHGEARPDAPMIELSGAQPAVPADEPVESLDDLAAAMEVAAHEAEKERQHEENVAAEMEEIVAQFAFDGPSLRTGVGPVPGAEAPAPATEPIPRSDSAAGSTSRPSTAPPLAPAPEPGSYDPQAQTSPPVQREVPRRSTQLLAAVGGLGASETGGVPRLAPPRPPAPPPVRATARLTAISGSAPAVDAPVDPVGTTLGIEPRPVLTPADAPGGHEPTEGAQLAAPPVEPNAETSPIALRGGPRDAAASDEAPPEPAPAPEARRGIANANAAVFEEPALDEMLDALESIQDASMAGTVPRATREEMARKAAEAKAAAQAAARPDSILAAAEERLRRLRAPTGTMQALSGASQLPGATGVVLPVAAPAEPIPGDSPETRALYEQFVAARHTCGELDELPYDRFVRRLEKNRTALKAQLNCADVRFRVDVEGGKATLKASPIR